MKISKVSKIGLMIEVISLVIMIIFLILSKPVPSIIMWIFVVGLAISLYGTVTSLSKRNKA